MSIKNYTVKDALKQCNMDAVCELLHQRHVDNDPTKKQHDKNSDFVAYKRVAAELLRKRKFRSRMPVVFERIVEEDESYINVSLLNTRYVAPPENLKPWGGRNPPTGYYNVNLNKHIKYFAFGSNWTEYVNAKVINSANLTVDQLVAEFLWEITFYGFSEKQSKNFFKSLTTRTKKIKKDIKYLKSIDLK